ncbi:MAG: NAD-binding protein [Chloroflexia bacterium]|nr:NAD-binding protein [Chloroflexia bacterium]
MAGDVPVPHRLRRFWRERVQAHWQTYRWLDVLLLWLLALVLGCLGFAQHLSRQGQEASFWDILYLALQLFTLESGAIPGDKGWALEIARYLAPLVAAYTALQALMILFHEQISMVRLRTIREHVVICGLGRRGHLLAQRFREQGRRVVLLERDEDNPLINHCREMGAIVLLGDATSDELLQQARIQQARYLLAVSGDDGVNAEVAIRARELLRNSRRRQALPCTVHVVNPQLCTLLRERELAMGEMASFRLSFFNVFDSGARALLQDYPPFEAESGRRPHLLVIGLGRMGESLILHAANIWCAGDRHNTERFQLRIIDREADWKTESLCLRYPHLQQVCELEPCTMDVRGPDFQRADFLCTQSGQCAISRVYICLDNESLALSTALSLHRRIQDRSIPIVVRMEQSGGLALLLEDVANAGHSPDNLHAFGLLERTCSPELVLGGSHETIARAIHEEYLQQRRQRDPSEPEDVALAPWEQLPAEYQESCRRQADHIVLKLQAVDCAIGPLEDPACPALEFSAAEVERMAQMEHERWLDERRQDGWRRGPKDREHKTHPYLVPWAKLPPEVQELNRDMVRGLASFLARVGLQVYRLDLSDQG